MHVATGRYERVTRATVPGDLPTEGHVNAHCQIVHGVVPDPNPAFRGKSQRAAINVKTDALEREYQLKRIDEGAYQAGRKYQRVLQRSRITVGASNFSQGDRVDQVISHEITILTRIERAEDAVEMLRDTAPVLGMMAQRLLELVLVDEMTLSAAAKRMRGSDDRQHVIYFSNLFRDSCHALSHHWCRRDRRPPRG